ncbi:hypothetical protein I6G56_23195 [Burkholderia humptydooensis]|uniref:Uncharacterized protein n=2 Tax=Burkholderia humptydooensis TaxID=430531 RepID=A0A7U4PAF3_9BURK|nr:MULTISPECIES: hypothetical protein [Burkholderia]AJY40642.1 hypothetical protein BW21_5461 [Burkholderia sp. 2002721687]ALX45854.1 hypothetical protein AQ610_25880 [Burkholderia humptydooensis]EIP86840.1 hypothetical protein A33K_16443 [Burkholderia humptydooensis MSMB43]QPS47344.1 hypothetical protein I6G56_23195 [Burkholderia humptydooensis]
MKLRNQVISDSVIELDAKEVHTLGPNLRLENCTINSDCTTRSLIASNTEMVGGVFNQRKALKNFQFDRVIFSGVKFTGTFIGCDFGNNSESLPGKALDCDFSQAKVHDSRVYECDPERIGFPAWPRFTIVNPYLARDYVMSQAWPADMGIRMGVYTNNPPRCNAIFGDAEVFAKEYKIGQDDLRRLLEKIPGIVIVD